MHQGDGEGGSRADWRFGEKERGVMTQIGSHWTPQSTAQHSTALHRNAPQHTTLHRLAPRRFAAVGGLYARCSGSRWWGRGAQR